jgi:hypothetical protein
MHPGAGFESPLTLTYFFPFYNDKKEGSVL